MKPDLSAPASNYPRRHTGEDESHNASESSSVSTPSAISQPTNTNGSRSRAIPPKKLLIGMAVIAAILIAAVAAVSINRANSIKAHDAAQHTSPPVVTVTLVKPVMKPVEDKVEVTGTVAAWDPLSVGSEISGVRIKEVPVEEGDLVKKGQPICILNSSVLRAQRDQAVAKLKSYEMALRKAIRPNRQEEISALRASLREAEANEAQEVAHVKQAHVAAENADLNAQRFDYLANAGAASDVDAETHRMTLDTNKQMLSSAEAKLSSSKSLTVAARERLLQAEHGGRAEDVEMGRAAIAEAKGQLEQLDAQLEQTVIRAPDDGLIAKRDAHIGDIANAGATLFQIIRNNKLEMKAQVPDLDLGKFQQGQYVTVSARETSNSEIATPGANHKPIVAKVVAVSPQVDATSRQGIVRILLPPDSEFKAGMFVRAEVTVGKRDALTVPAQSVVARNGGLYVFNVESSHPDRATMLPVKVGVQSPGDAEIMSGVSANQDIIFKGARFLNDQDVIRVSKE